MFSWLKERKLSHAEWWKKYREYLASEKWQKKRQKVLKRDKNQCQQRKFLFFKCKSTRKLQVHHKTYKRVFKERLGDLITLCSKCHLAEHERLKKEKKNNLK